MSRAEFLEALESNNIGKLESGSKPSKLLLYTPRFKKTCNFCSNPNHLIYSCPDFLKLPIRNRIEKVNELKLCPNCLSTSKHDIKYCKAGSCKVCKASHSNLLHIDISHDTVQVEPNKPINSINLFSNVHKYVLLSTALIDIYDARGNKYGCKAILDSGS